MAVRTLDGESPTRGESSPSPTLKPPGQNHFRAVENPNFYRTICADSAAPPIVNYEPSPTPPVNR